jgi:hypothetical protein
LSLAPAEAKLASDGDIWIAATSSNEPAGQIVFRIDSVTAAGLVQSSVGHGKESDNLPAADNQTVLLELFRKSTALFCTRAKVPKVELQVEFSSAPSKPSAATYW